MAKLKILAHKTFKVGRRNVLVRMQDAPGEEKPYQVFVRAQVKGVTKKQTSSYATASGNREAEYHEFDQQRADQYVASIERFLGTKKGEALANG